MKNPNMTFAPQRIASPPFNGFDDPIDTTLPEPDLIPDNIPWEDGE
ncbi:MAG: hypothetical protein J4215_06145 [Candidatus Diapherotrites archaeon]|uniref:Uncharacterized protein n=1 Tax=Candidatus Iainarchaeum sp. TaxID=3101447 RepID=A0A8T4L680_9ARCH|nr:hypothetical protein [Candidatus Diapherotrites archaeon]